MFFFAGVFFSCFFDAGVFFVFFLAFFFDAGVFFSCVFDTGIFYFLNTCIIIIIDTGIDFSLNTGAVPRPERAAVPRASLPRAVHARRGAGAAPPCVGAGGVCGPKALQGALSEAA